MQKYESVSENEDDKKRLLKWGQDYAFALQEGFKKAEQSNSFIAWKEYIKENLDKVTKVFQDLEKIKDQVRKKSE